MTSTVAVAPALNVDQLHVLADAIQALQHDIAHGGTWWHEYDATADDPKSNPAEYQQLVTEAEAAINTALSTVAHHPDAPTCHDPATGHTAEPGT